MAIKSGKEDQVSDSSQNDSKIAEPKLQAQLQPSHRSEGSWGDTESVGNQRRAQAGWMCVPTCVEQSRITPSTRHLTHTDTPQDRLLVGIRSRGSQHVMGQLSNLAITSVYCCFLLAFSYPVCPPQENTETVTVFAVLLEYQLL